MFEKIVDKPFSEKGAAEVTRQLLEAISFCHELGIVHRDLKPENILLRDEQEPVCIKLADFNLSKDVSQGTMALKTVVGTDCYYSPEIVNGEPVSFFSFDSRSKR